MVSINTNLSSLLVQNNLAQSTNSLSKAVERLTTGYKINHASDNAAGYSIAQDMTSKLSSYDVAADNISMGLDLLSVAQTTISQMQSRGERLMALWTQAQNGTYGPTSLSAINQEATAIIEEINRLSSNTEYNGIKLFAKNIEVEDAMPKAGVKRFIVEVPEPEIDEYEEETSTEIGLSSPISTSNNGFIKNAVTHTQSEVNALTHVSDVDSFTPDTEYQVSTLADLQKLAALTNSGVDTEGVTFVMGADIDMSSVANWSSIGYYDGENMEYVDGFKGIFDGNGHTISNLKINNEEADNQGLFGKCVWSAEIKNVALKNVNINAHNNVGAVAGRCYNVENCYVTGSIKGNTCVGGIVGQGDSISYASSDATVNGTEKVGGISGDGGNASECGFTGAVSGLTSIGGILGKCSGSASHCYSVGTITGNSNIGGIVGNGHFTSESMWGPSMGMECDIEYCYSESKINYIGEGGSNIGGLAGCAGYITYSYSTCNIIASDADNVGSLAGQSDDCNTCYATGSVKGQDFVGGLVGNAKDFSISNCYATGFVSGNDRVGGLSGGANLVNNCYALGDVNGNDDVGGLSGIISCYGGGYNTYSEGNVSGNNNVGGLFGSSENDLYVDNCYSTGYIDGNNNVGGLIGLVVNGSIENSYTTSEVSGNKNVGGIIGQIYSDYESCNELYISNVISYADISGNNSTGGLIGDYSYEYYNEDWDETVNYSLNISGSKCAKSSFDIVGSYSSCTESNGVCNFEYNNNYDSSSLLENVNGINVDFGGKGEIQVGVNGDASSSIAYNTGLKANINISDISSQSAYNTIKNFLNVLSEKATELGATSNRLESALESTTVAMENLTSSLSTIKDADIAKESSGYIKKQILQQASATLLATANQSPSIALQLL